MTATDEWRRALSAVMTEGLLAEPDSAGSAWKGRACRELLGLQTRVPMRQPVVMSTVRPIPKKFMTAEAAWILSGDNRVETIAPFSQKIKQFSDDGQRFYGAYGPRYVSQLSHVVRTLLADPESRQAVIQVWHENPPQTNDTPCTISWQYLMRDGLLNCIATMRSSDLITGWPVDVFNFSMCAAGVLLELRRARPKGVFADVELGDLILTAGSQHVYRLDFALAKQVLEDAEPSTLGYDRRKEPFSINLDEFIGVTDLASHLWYLARGQRTARSYLEDLFLP